MKIFSVYSYCQDFATRWQIAVLLFIGGEARAGLRQRPIKYVKANEIIEFPEWKVFIFHKMYQQQMIFNKKRTPVLPHLSSECERTTNYCILPYSQRCSNLKLLWSMMLKATFTNYFFDIKNTIFKEKKSFLNIHCLFNKEFRHQIKKKCQQKIITFLVKAQSLNEQQNYSPCLNQTLFSYRPK